DRKHILAAAFLVNDDLCQNIMGYVISALGIDNNEIHVIAGQFSQKIKRDIIGRLRIIEPPVRIFLDNDRTVRVTLFRLVHVTSWPSYPVSFYFCRDMSCRLFPMRPTLNI